MGKILVTVTYVIEADRTDFWDTKNGRLRDDISESLCNNFPEKISFTDKAIGYKDHLSHNIINRPGANLLTCPACNRLITDSAKPNPIPLIRQSKELAGVFMCHSCAWELEGDVRSGRSIESIIAVLEESNDL
ncbi:MAG: hypothetical protein ACRDBO_16390 [Lachnospiraceae bacterium]